MPKRERLERDVVADILKVIRSLGGFAEKTHGNAFTRRGLLDVIACYRGNYIALEAKRGEHHLPTTLQLRVIEEIRAAGGRAEVVWSADKVRAILHEYDTEEE